MYKLLLLLFIIGCAAKKVDIVPIETIENQEKQIEKKDSYNKKYKELYGYYPDQYGNNADWEDEIYLDGKLLEEDEMEDNRDAEKSEKDK